ncbi:hypothetical protein C8F04DRAFT_1184750 [Mycena alexandri]|uniref:Myb/SANT-like domain-containing protein n=1 Tax=Mycena alexandri TaxID=1745969 RepID=A0AAD6SUC2_9AGAR|nr:hypothetical protein C8F04DRAFT_1184750 [Mycena alexandri]
MAPAAKNKTPAEKAIELSLPDSGNAAWTRVDDRALLVFLVDEKAAAGDNGQFKAPTLRATAAALNLIRSKGGPKTYQSCGQKYRQHRKFWALVDLIINTSGWTWSHEHGVTVDPSTQGAWDAFVKQYPDAARFKNEGWAYYELMAPLMPTKAKGGNVFRTNIPAALPKASSPEWDEERMNADFPSDEDKDDEPAPASSGAADDNEDEEKGEESDSSSPITPKKDKGKQAAQPAPPHHKKPRVSAGAQGLFDIARAAEKFNGIFEDFHHVLAQPQPAPAATGVASMSTITAPAATLPPSAFQTSPQRRTSAIVGAQNETWLTNRERVALVRVLTVLEKAEVYNALLTDDIRIPWIIDELQKVGVFAFHPEHSALEF